MPTPDPGAETPREIQQIQKRITEINAEYAYLIAKKIGDDETVRKIHWLPSGKIRPQSMETWLLRRRDWQRLKEHAPRRNHWQHRSRRSFDNGELRQSGLPPQDDT